MNSDCTPPPLKNKKNKENAHGRNRTYIFDESQVENLIKPFHKASLASP